MEFLLTDLLETRKFKSKREAFYREIDHTIELKSRQMNAIVDEILGFNESEKRANNFIQPDKKRFVKHLVTIDQSDVKNKMGSGQRMFLLLKLTASSSKTHIIIDEPERYSHPSLLNRTAALINDLVRSGKRVYIATHSPKLVSMLELDLDNLYIINDRTHNPKKIPFDKAISESAEYIYLDQLPDGNKIYYSSGNELKNCIQRRQSRQFIEALFSKRIYLCEGANDEIVINAALRQFKSQYDDYCIFKTWGKMNMPVFAELFQLLGLELVCLFDVDERTDSRHNMVNNAIRSIVQSGRVIEMDPNLEEELGFDKKKSDTQAFIEFIDRKTLSSKFGVCRHAT
ncbi:ATP-dependent nuclease [Slackia exigua]|uniref:ATP-dependent nuclease n=1 Tax=Slackia exigua TaxID=84109 RepID=UPI003AB9357B